MKYTSKTQEDWFTLLKRINKLEHLFPTGSELTICNNRFGIREDKSNYSLDNKYTTSRKFAGFREDFTVSKPSFHSFFEDGDEVTNELVRRMRAAGFLVDINVIPDSKDPLGPHSGCVGAIAHGHNLTVGFSTFDNRLFNYYDGIDNVLFDYKGSFDKWSRCEQVKKPKTMEEVAGVIEYLLNYSRSYDDKQNQ